LTITSRNGVAVPLSQVAQLNYEYEEPILWRRNRDMVLTVRGDIIDRVQAPDVSKAVEPKLQSIKDAPPCGYRIETGGFLCALEWQPKPSEVHRDPTAWLGW
jgi:multidrug efflux pump